MKFTSVLAVTLAFVVVAQAAPMQFTKRRFGQEHTPEADDTFQDVKDLAQGSDKEAQAGNLSGAMVRALLAKAPACDQQDRADEVIDLGQAFGGEKEQQYIEVAKRYRQLERNTPQVGQPSELCNKPPRHEELEGLVQAQDPTGKGNDKPKDGDDKPKDGDDKPKDGDDKPKGGDDKPKDGDDKPKDNPKDPKDEDAGENVAETNPVGGVKMPKIQQVDGDFIVNGNGFNGNLDAAHSRQCDVQHNLCFNKFNSGDRSFSGQDCETQSADCKAGPPVFA